MAQLSEYEVEIRDGIWVTMKLSREHAEQADPKRVRPVGGKARPTANKARTPANKAG
ncbi:hypothetical protein ACTWP5_27605 [Streptomyces sp. 4N509B]|uniref:hypothetical protein n=1 Tax=Streptomyces sp. 4N509B TaxID=3457413 RepID=UPI003FD4AE37